MYSLESEMTRGIVKGRVMQVRKVQEHDLERVRAICIRAFKKSIASSLHDEGIHTFKSIVAHSAFLQRMQQDNVLLAVECNGTLVGMIELKTGCHVAMLFVDPEFQNNGVGRTLLHAILNHVRADILTVSASLTSVGAYKKYGFNCIGEIQESSGLVYQPMELCM